MEQLSLFTQEVNMNAPLASRLRPQSLNDYIGQEHLVGPGKVLRRMLEKDMISSMIFWGPPGVGKTTFVKAVAGCLGIEDDVNSPTFAIVNEYLTATGDSVFHFDFYRVKNIEEAMDFGYEEYFYSGNRCFIEWPEMVEPLLPENTLICKFSELADGRRELVIEEKL